MNESSLKELKNLLRTGLKESSNTNKTRYAILALLDEALESQMSDLRKEVDRMKGDENMFGGSALTNSKCKICDSGFVANSTAGGICHRCRRCLDEVLLLIDKFSSK